MAVLVIGPLAAGMLAGYAAGGRLRDLLRTRIRAVWLLWTAAAIQFVQFEMPAARDALGVPLLVPVFGLVAAWLLVNLPGRPRAVRLAVAVILLGGGLNAAAIAANGRMPYSVAALESAQVSPDQRARGERSPKHVAADDRTRLIGLGDVIPVRPLGKVVSLGDLVLLAGVAALLAAAMHRSAAGPHRSRPGSGQAGRRAAASSRTAATNPLRGRSRQSGATAGNAVDSG
jgi:hypothetical protein